DERAWPCVSRQGCGDPCARFRGHGASTRRVVSRARPMGPRAEIPLRTVGTGAGRPRVKAAVVGATRGMGRAVARLLAERGGTVVLLGRDAAELAISARDLSARGARGIIATGRLDLAEPSAFSAALDQADQASGGLDMLVVTAGDFAAHEALARDAERLRRLLDVNFTATAVLCQLAAERFAARGGGTICAFSSVAGGRARRSNYLYGAPKAGPSAFPDGPGLPPADPNVPALLPPPGSPKPRPARLREDRHDRGASRPALRGRARRRRARRPPCARPRRAGRLRPAHLALGHAPHPLPSPRHHATNPLLDGGTGQGWHAGAASALGPRFPIAVE